MRLSDLRLKALVTGMMTRKINLVYSLTIKTEYLYEDIKNIIDRYGRGSDVFGMFNDDVSMPVFHKCL